MVAMTPEEADGTPPAVSDATGFINCAGWMDRSDFTEMVAMDRNRTGGPRDYWRSDADGQTLALSRRRQAQKG